MMFYRLMTPPKLNKSECIPLLYKQTTQHISRANNMAQKWLTHVLLSHEYNQLSHKNRAQLSKLEALEMHDISQIQFLHRVIKTIYNQQCNVQNSIKFKSFCSFLQSTSKTIFETCEIDFLEIVSSQQLKQETSCTGDQGQNVKRTDGMQSLR